MRFNLPVVLLTLLSWGCGSGSGRPLADDDPAGPRIEAFSCTPAAGAVPMLSTCTFFVREAANKPVTCSLDVNGDGAAEYTLPNCGLFSLQTHTFGSAGTFPVKLTATNSDGAYREKATTVTVLAHNEAPAIAVFVAEPERGQVPFTTTLRWSISDPESHPLTCLVDTNTDGKIDLTVNGCSSSTPAQVTFDTVGTYDVSLVVRDAFGGTAQKATVVSAEPQFRVDLRLARVDWAQTVVKPDLKLIPGKPAQLRVLVVSDQPNVPVTTVRAEATLGTTSLGVLDLAGPASFPTTEDMTQAFAAQVPDAWLVPNASVTVTVDPANALAETDEANNVRTQPVLVGAATVLHLTAVPVVQQGLTGRVPSNFAPRLWQFWPLHSTQSTTRAPYTFSGQITAFSAQGWSDLLTELASVRQADGSRRHYYGFVQVNFFSGVAGIGMLGFPVATGRDDSIDTMVHELGHNFDRDHAPCNTQGDPAYPYPGARIGSWGFNPATQQLIDPSRSVYDVMSYCDPVWVSDYSYQGAQARLEQRPPQAYVIGGSQPQLLIAGRIDAKGVSLKPLQRFTGAPFPFEEGPYVLRLFTAHGVTEHGFATQRVADVDEAFFSLVVPDVGDVRALEIHRAGRRLLRREAVPLRSAASPSVRHLGDRLRVQWDAAVLPYAMVAHVGEFRTTLTLYAQGGRLELPTAGLPEGGHFEVGLSDGLNAQRWTLGR